MMPTIYTTGSSGFSDLSTALLSRCSRKQNIVAMKGRKKNTHLTKNLALETAHSCLFHNPPIHKQNIVSVPHKNECIDTR